MEAAGFLHVVIVIFQSQVYFKTSHLKRKKESQEMLPFKEKN